MPAISAAHLDVRLKLQEARKEAKEFTLNGDDIPVVNEWVWPEARVDGANAWDAVAVTGGDNE